jgi:tripartite-type tricarboxylate transporter receptor subunit TctC
LPTNGLSNFSRNWLDVLARSVFMRRAMISSALLWRAGCLLHVPIVLWLGMTAALAADYPSRPIRLIVSFPAGGASDILGRAIGQKLSERFGQPVVIDNRGGAGGTIAAEAAAKASPDGYSLLMGAGAHALAPSIYARLGYDFIRDFAPITLVARSAYLVLLNPAVPANSIRELIALAKAEPGRLNFASPGTGAPPHLAGELFNTMAGVKLIHVPYRGDTQALTDLVGGQVQLGFIAVSASLPLVRSGQLKAIAVTSAERTPVLPELPTVAEAGLPGYAIGTWFGLLAPAGTPPAVIARLHDATARIVAGDDIRERFATIGFEAISDSPAGFAQHIRAETENFARIAQAAGIQPE